MDVDMKPDPSITELLARQGITHQRDASTQRDSRHRLYANGEYLGRFDALEAAALVAAIQ